MHDLDLILTFAAALGSAVVLGYATQRLRLSPIVGYLLAGILVGPHTPGFVADAKLAAQLAELGVILLMFGVGLHLRLSDLMAVRRVAVPGAVLQSLVATLLGVALVGALGWGLGAGLVLGIGLAVASTVVLMRGLVDTGRLDSPAGHVAVGWLVVEDVFTVVVLVLLPVLAQGGADAQGIVGSLGWTLLKFVGLVALVLWGGEKVIPRVMIAVARTRSRELFTLTVLAIALLVAVLSATIFGVSMALGAFLAGMVVGRSRVSHQAASDALPLRDAFAVLFFVSVGMLFDPAFVLENPLFVLGVLAIILVAKPLVAIVVVLLLGHSVRTGLTVAIGLAQIGEFSFILAEAGRAQGLLPPEGQSVLVAGALLSITVNPLLFRALDPLEAALRRRPRVWRLLEGRADRRGASFALAAPGAGEEDTAVHAVVVGHGPVGQTCTRLLREFGIRVTVIEMNVETVANLTRAGLHSVYGDASRSEVLEGAGIRGARWLLVTLPDLASRIPVILAAREMNPNLRILARARYLREHSLLREFGVDYVSYEEAEVAVALAETLLREVNATEDRIAAEVRRIRHDLFT